MKKLLQILAGLIFLAGPIYAWGINWHGLGFATWTFLKGGAMWMAMLIGLVLLVLGVSNLKD